MSARIKEPIEVCGITLTPDMVSVLDSWQSHLPTDISMPEMYVNYLTDIQDHLTIMLADYGDHNQENGIVDLLTKLIIIKEDIKKFAARKQ